MERGRIALIVILVFLIGISLSFLLYMEADYKYREMKGVYLQEKIERLHTFISREKEWILSNQDPDGPIYMNQVESEDAVGDVNPYFASLAAQGLLSGAVTEEELRQVGQYIDWHAEQLLAENGEISHYLLSENGLTIHSEPDSVDSYIAVFVSLLKDYVDKGGSLDPETKEQIVNLSLNKLDALTKDGLTRVREGSQVYYYMDNIEVLAAYIDLVGLLEDKEQIDIVEKRIQEMEAGLKDLWDDQDQVYHIGVMENGQIIPTEDLNNLYPDGIVQIYNIAFEVYPKGYHHAQEQYQKFSQNINWQDMDYLEQHNFYWTELLHISAVMEELDWAEEYLKKYEEQLMQSRKYPFHTGTAGWSIKAGVKMIEKYEKWMNQSLWYDYKNNTRINADE